MGRTMKWVGKTVAIPAAVLTFACGEVPGEVENEEQLGDAQALDASGEQSEKAARLSTSRVLTAPNADEREGFGGSFTRLEEDAEGNIVTLLLYNRPTNVGGQALPFQGEEGNTEHLGIVKLRPNGTPVWVKGFQGLGYGAQLAVDAEGSIFLGATTVNAVSFGGSTLEPGTVLAKFSPNGTHLWSRTTRPEAGTTFLFDDLEPHPQGGFIALAHQQRPPVAKYQYPSLMLIRYNTNGTPVWSRIYQEGSSENGAVWGSDLAIDPFGQLYVAGTVGGTTTLGGKPYSTEGAPLLAAFRSDGQVRWSQQLAQEGVARAVDTLEGHLMVEAGIVSAQEENVRSTLMSFDLAGNRRWEQKLGTVYYSSSVDVELGPNREVTVLVQGNVPGQVVADPLPRSFAFFVAKFDRVQGRKLAVREFPLAKPATPARTGWADPAELLVKARSGQVVVSGTFADPTDFGTGVLRSERRDGFLLYLTP